jgi:hypothetical protein
LVEATFSVFSPGFLVSVSVITDPIPSGLALIRSG